MHYGRRLLGLGLLVLLTGCGPARPKTYEVSGIVTWDGEAVADGYISFCPLDGTVVPEGGKIKNGHYRFRSRPGKKRVQIYADREGAFDPVMQSPKREPLIPLLYNSERSPLTADVQPDGDNRFSFHLPLKQ
jgi:hypothetical protein